MPPRVRMVFAAMLFTLFLIPALAICRELSKPADIWWTPRPLMAPFSESGDRVEVYVRGKSLGTLLETGQLSIIGETPNALAGSDIGFRFNNWDRVRAQRIPILLGYAAICGMTATLLFIVMTGRLAYRGERKAVRNS